MSILKSKRKIKSKRKSKSKSKLKFKFQLRYFASQKKSLTIYGQVTILLKSDTAIENY